MTVDETRSAVIINFYADKWREDAIIALDAHEAEVRRDERRAVLEIVGCGYVDLMGYDVCSMAARDFESWCLRCRMLAELDAETPGEPPSR